MKPCSLDERWEALKAEYAAQESELPRYLGLWYQRQCRCLEERLAIAEHEGRTQSDQKGAA